MIVVENVLGLMISLASLGAIAAVGLYLFIKSFE